MDERLTTIAGCPVADAQNTLTAGPRGPQLLQDVWFLEKLDHFDREVISNLGDEADSHLRDGHHCVGGLRRRNSLGIACGARSRANRGGIRAVG